MGLSAISLFSGAGGLDLAAKWAGIRTVAYVEWFQYAQAVLISRMRDGGLDEAPLWSDVSAFDGKPWCGKVDIVFGGFPCQDVSIAGKQVGITEGKRSGLWKEFARIIREVGPRFVLVENVTGLLMGGVSELFLEIWPTWGLMLDGKCYQPEQLAPPISENESFLLPTPTAHMWDFPMVSWKTATLKMKGEGRKSGAGIGSDLCWDLCVNYLLTGCEKFPAWVNPRFCEWMMGWPQRWSLASEEGLNYVGTVSFRSKLSRSSKKSSGPQE